MYKKEREQKTQVLLARFTHLNVVVSVVVKVEDSVQLTLHGDVKVLPVLDSLAESLSGVFFHLDVVKFPGNILAPLGQLQ